MKERVTGKKLAAEAITLARDFGIYFLSVGLKAFKIVKSAFSKGKDKDVETSETDTEKHT